MNRMSKSIIAKAIFGALIAAGTGAAHATQAVWDVSYTPSWGRGTPGSLYAEWSFFTDDADPALIQDNTPEVGLFPAGHPYSLTENTGTAFLTSGGNIYSFSAPTDFTLTTTGSADAGARDAVLHIGSLGSEFAYGSFTLNGATGAWTELFSGSASQGLEKEFLITWNGIPNAANFVFDFNAAASSVSFDQLSLDIAPVSAVPLPPAVWLFGSGLAGLVGIARRKAAARA